MCFSILFYRLRAKVGETGEPICFYLTCAATAGCDPRVACRSILVLRSINISLRIRPIHHFSMPDPICDLLIHTGQLLHLRDARLRKHHDLVEHFSACLVVVGAHGHAPNEPNEEVEHDDNDGGDERSKREIRRPEKTKALKICLKETT